MAGCMESADLRVAEMRGVLGSWLTSFRGGLLVSLVCTYAILLRFI